MLIFNDFSRTKSIQTTLTNLTRRNLILFCVSGEFFVSDINGFSRGTGYQKNKKAQKAKMGAKSKNGRQKNKKRRGKTKK